VARAERRAATIIPSCALNSKLAIWYTTGTFPDYAKIHRAPLGANDTVKVFGRSHRYYPNPVTVSGVVHGWDYGLNAAGQYGQSYVLFTQPYAYYGYAQLGYTASWQTWWRFGEEGLGQNSCQSVWGDSEGPLFSGEELAGIIATGGFVLFCKTEVPSGSRAALLLIRPICTATTVGPSRFSQKIAKRGNLPRGLFRYDLEHYFATGPHFNRRCGSGLDSIRIWSGFISTGQLFYVFSDCYQRPDQSSADGGLSKYDVDSLQQFGNWMGGGANNLLKTETYKVRVHFSSIPVAGLDYSKVIESINVTDSNAQYVWSNVRPYAAGLNKAMIMDLFPSGSPGFVPNSSNAINVGITPNGQNGGTTAVISGIEILLN